MNTRILGKTTYTVSEIGYGAWAIGADWGEVSRDTAEHAVNEALERQVTFFDTADVYGDGRSEQILAETTKSKRNTIVIATKAGRRLSPHVAKEYTEEHLREFISRSLHNLQTDSLDLLQLHCPPTQVFYMPEVFEALDTLVKEGKIKHYGVSVEKVEEALKAIEYPGVSTVQIIFNMFRQRPAELFFERAKKKNIGVIVRVPLASGLLTGKMSSQTTFDATDHRQFNRHGEFFDVGETFAGVDFETGLQAVSELKKLTPEGWTLSQFALRWILMFDAVSTVIPGGKTAEQVKLNTAASELPPIDTKTMQKVRDIYEEFIKPQVHQRW